MFAIVGGLIFSGAALFALLVIVQMLRGYLPTMVAALEGNPLPRTLPRPEPRRRMRRVPHAFTPLRIEPVRAAA